MKLKWAALLLAVPGAAFAQPMPTYDPAKLQLPSLAFNAGAEDQAGFDKYYYFHREGTSFQDALVDVRECDGLARGLASPYGYTQVYSPNLAGVAGGVIGNLIVSAVFGSAEIRKNRRVNMRRCMNYKGYQRYGLPKDVWEKFNFEEGLGKVPEERRQFLLALQAKAASGAKPQNEGLGL